MSLLVRPTALLIGWLRRIPGPAAAGLAALALGGCLHCGGYSAPPTPGPIIVSFTAARGVVTRGDSTQLTAVFQSGAGRVDQGVGAVASDAAVTVGPLAATTTFTLTVTGISGATSVRPVTVTVVPPPDPAITGPAVPVAPSQSCTASVATQAGSTYAWTLSGGTIPGAADQPSVSFSSNAYGLLQLACTVTNAAGRAATDSFTAELGGATVFSFTATPGIITQGDPVTLDYDFSGGDAVLAPLGEAIPGDPGPAAGSLEDSPDSSTTYVLTVTDRLGQVSTGAARVTVVPAPVITSFTAAPPIIGTDEPATLTAVFAGGTGVVSSGPSYRAPITSGVALATPDLAESTSLTLTVTNAAGREATAQAPVLVGSLAVLAGVPSGEGSLDGTGTGARFYHPVGAALQASGNLVVADAGNHTLRVVTPQGDVTTLAGTEGVPGSADGEESEAAFDQVSGVAVDGTTGNFYLTDTGNDTIRLMTFPSGAVTTLAGQPGSTGFADDPQGQSGVARFNHPQGIAVGQGGTYVYVADTGNNTLRKLLASSRSVTTLAGAAPQAGLLNGRGPLALFSGPAGLALDGAVTNKLFAADAGNNAVRAVDTLGNASTAATGPFANPQGIAVDGKGVVYLADTGNSVIWKMIYNGSSGTTSLLAGTARQTGSGNGPGAQATFNRPAGLAADAAGNLWVVDTGNSVIRRLAAGGPVATVCGMPPEPGSGDGAGGAARMNAPGALGLDARGNVYFVDTGNSSVRTISAAGQVATLAGAAARFSSPAGLAVQPGPGGTVAAIYVADTGNHTIRVVTPGVPVQVATLAGTAGVAGFQDSSEPGSADGARFNAPAGLALDLQGNLYVADRGNQAIRMIAPDGTVSTVAGNPAAVGADDGGAGLASFNGPSAVAVTVDGSTLYVADTGNHLVRRIQDGSVSTLAGTAGEPGSADGSKDTLLNAPVAIALDNAGNLYVTNNGSSTVCQITPGGTVSTIIGNPALSANVFSPDPLPSLLAHPRGIAVDPATGNIFVSIDDAVMKVDFHP